MGGPNAAETLPAKGESGPPVETALLPEALSRIASYEVLGAIGGGGSGVVYRARDRDRGQIVALKTLSYLDAESFAALKLEFRAVADIVHDNLVTLHQLRLEEGVPYFTMELVEGTDFVTYVRGEPSVMSPRRRGLDDEGVARLRDALAQLARGVAALHGAGKLHRDLKPRNVMVTPEGRVVILDFGLVLESVGAADSDGRIVGTPAYMAPEQSTGEAIGAAADWFAVGVTLYQALTGKLPFGRTVDELVRAFVEPRPRPSQIVGGLPDDLDELCAELLALSPDRRPTGAAVLARLEGGDPPAVTEERGELEPGRVPWVGRRDELAALTAAWSETVGDRAVVVHLEGASGAGKTSLVRRWLETASPADALVLRSRCHERESFSFKAFDGLVEDLVRHLEVRDAREIERLWPSGGDALVRLFPVLRRLRLEHAAERPTTDLQTLRRRGFRALEQLLGALARERPILVWIDDLHWCDSDSTDLLVELLAEPSPAPALWICTRRPTVSGTDAGASEALRSVERLDLREIELDRLSDDDSVELARLTASRLHHSAWSSGQLEELARESVGNPLLVEQLVREALDAGMMARTVTDGRAPSLHRVVGARVERLPEDAHRLLEVVAVAGHPVPQRIALEVAHPSGDPWATMGLLRAENLVRTHGVRGWDAVEAWHDSIRESVTSRIDVGRRGRYHAALAEALERRAENEPEQVDPAQLAAHYQGAGQLEAAGRYAMEAAERAAAALAFDRAASLYALARECGFGDAAELLRLEADALVAGGRCADAVPLYLDAARRSSRETARELRRLAAEQLLVSGRVDEGVEALRPVLGELGLRYPRTPARALASVAYQFAKLKLRGLDFTPRSTDEIPDRLLQQIDLCWSAGKGLLSYDSVRAADFLLRMLRLSLRAGDPHLASRALAVFGMMQVFQGDRRSHRQGSRVLARADRVAPTGDRYLEGTNLICRGTAEMSIGGFRRGLSMLEEGIAILETGCPSVRWECSAARSSIFTCLSWIGDMAEMRERAVRYRRNGQQVGDLFLVVTSELYGAIASLAEDRPSEARRATRAAIRKWAQEGYHYQHWFADKIEIWCDLYEGDARAAVRRCEGAMRRVRRSGLLRIQLMELDALLLRGRVTLASAARRRVGRKARLGRVRLDARRLDRLGREVAAAGARFLRGQIALLEGDRGQAVSHLSAAARRFGAGEADMHALAAGRLAAIARDDEEAIEENDRAMAVMGVARPEGWLRVHAEVVRGR